MNKREANIRKQLASANPAAYPMSRMLLAEIDKLRAALEFYGNEQNYLSGSDDWSPIQLDEGEQARKVLEEEG